MYGRGTLLRSVIIGPGAAERLLRAPAQWKEQTVASIIASADPVQTVTASHPISSLGAPPPALHRGESDLPFVPYQEGVTFQLIQVDIEAGFFVVRVRGEPGRTIQRHKHTGEIFAFTSAGSWKYLEYPEVNTAGSYLYEPAGSVHTLHFPETNTEVTDVSFVLHGANLNLDAAGNVESVLDATAALAVYRAGCRDGGFPDPNVIGV
jgi:quercetin dioxygenase-like cupin family protein